MIIAYFGISITIINELLSEEDKKESQNPMLWLSTTKIKFINHWQQRSPSSHAHILPVVRLVQPA